MKANIDPIQSSHNRPLRGPVQNPWRILMPCRRLPFLAVFIIALGAQTAQAQGTVFIGGQGTPGVTINLSAIYGSPDGSYVAPIPSLQPDLAGRLSVRRLQIPNLRLTPPVRRITLRPPGRAPTRAMASPAAPVATAAAAVPRVAKMPAAPLPAVTRTVRAPATAKPAAVKQAPAQLARLSPPPPPRAVVARKAPPPPAVTPSATAPTVMAPKAKAPVARAPVPKVAAPKAPRSMAALPKAPSLKTSTRRKSASKTLAPPPPPPPPTIIRKADKASTTAAAPRAGAPVTKSRQRLAALTPSGDNLVRLRFRAGSSVLTGEDEGRLKAMADKVAPTEARLQLKAYAAGKGNNTSKARRLSLSRALAVRSFLIENGLRSTRIDVRALGIARDGGAPDRVDIVLLER